MYCVIRNIFIICLLKVLLSVLQIRYTCLVQVDHYPMKKTAMTLLACAALGVAYGQEEQQKSGFGLEVNAAYNFALKDIRKAEEGVPAFKVDTYGVDLTALYAINEHHAVNIRFGYAMGEEEHAIDLGSDYYLINAKGEVRNIYIMPGYRLTTPLNDSLYFFGGVNVGLAQTKVKEEISFAGVSESETKSKWGFAWSAEVGLSQKVSQTGAVTLSVQLLQLLGRPDFGADYGDGYESDKVENQLSLGVRLGYSCQF